MPDNIGITPGAGATAATDEIGGVHYQRVKLVDGTADSTTAIPGDASNGLDVDVTRVQGSVTVVQATATNLKVDASAVPVPVTDGAGSLTVDSAQLPASLVSGRLDVNIGASSGTVTVGDGGGTISVDDGAGSLTVDGTVTVNQGTPAATANRWPVQLSDGTNVAGLTNVSGQMCLKVDVVQDAGGAAQTDKSGFTEGSARVSVVAGVLNDTIAADPAEDQAAAARITPKRALHANLRNNSGAEIGVSGAPVRVDPTGTTTQPVSGTVTATLSSSTNAGAAAKTADYDTGAGTDTVTMFGLALPGSGGAVVAGTSTNPIRVDPTGSTAQPVSGTVTANQGGAPWAFNLTQVAGAAVVTGASGLLRVALADEAGGAFGHANPIHASIVPTEETVVRNAVTYSASQSDIALLTPTTGKRLYVLGIIITPTLAGGLVKIYDATNAAGSMIYQGQPPLGSIVIQFSQPLPLSAINNVLRYSTGGSSTGDITVWGYER